MDYATLQTDIASWLDRSDLAAHIPQFIAMAETKMNRFLRTGDQSLNSSITGDGSAEYLIADDIRGLRSVSIGGRPLAFLTPDGLKIATEANYQDVYFYTIEGLSVALNKPVDDTTTLDLLGYKQVPALSDTITTNWVLDRHYDAYLYGAMAEGCRFIKDYAQETSNRALFSSALTDIQSEDQNDRWSGDTMQMVAG